MADNIDLFNDIIIKIDENTTNLEDFLSVQNDTAFEFQQTTKNLYDLTKQNSNHKNNALPELLTQDFDEEQIWQQLELQNESELTHYLTEVSRVLTGNNKLVLPLSLSTNPDSSDDPDSIHNKNSNKHKIKKLKKNANEKQIFDNVLLDSDEEINSDIDLDDDEKDSKKHKEKNSKNFKNKSSIVDDQFFKLHELDEYLKSEEKKPFKANYDESDEDVENDDDDDDDDNGDGDGDDDDNKKNKNDVRMLKYTDFFDSPDSSNNPTDIGIDANISEKEKIDFHSSLGDNYSSDKDIEKNDIDDSHEDNKLNKAKLKKSLKALNDNSNEDESSENEKKVKSAHEGRQERLKKRIEEYENKALSEKPWQLRGEISATNRPQNSLLEEYVEFDLTTRPAPVITEETTIKLEDIIKQRIKDKAWDDVEKKFKPVETPMEYKKKLVMDQEKSKKSLAEIYQEAYLRQKEALDPDSQEKEEEEPKEHTEIRQMMHSLFQKLDALSNFHYTPKMAQPEIKIISNIPAVTIEEVAPIATADSALLAPEEVQAKQRGDLIGKSERTKTDKKRERRKKKVIQRNKFKAKEEKEKKLSDLKKNKKQVKMAEEIILKKLTKDRNVKRIDKSNHKVAKSSTAFFTQLQDEVTELVKSKAKLQKKKQKPSYSAVKLKL